MGSLMLRARAIRRGAAFEAFDAADNEERAEACASAVVVGSDVVSILFRKLDLLPDFFELPPDLLPLVGVGVAAEFGAKFFGLMVNAHFALLRLDDKGPRQCGAPGSRIA